MPPITSPPRSPTKQTTENRPGALRVPASPSFNAAHLRTKTPEGRTATHNVDTNVSIPGFVQDGPYLPSSPTGSRPKSKGPDSLHVSGRPTRDSMVENMLLSFNKIPNGQALDRTYPPSSYTKPATDFSNNTLGRQSFQAFSGISQMNHKVLEPLETNRRHQKNALSMSAAANGRVNQQAAIDISNAPVAKQARRSSVGEFTFYDMEPNAKGMAPQRRAGPSPQLRGTHNHSASLDIANLGTSLASKLLQPTAQKSRPATAPYGNSEAAPSPTVSAGLRTLHSPISSNPRQPHRQAQPLSSSSIALAAAAAAASAKSSGVRNQPAITKLPEPKRLEVIRTYSDPALSSESIMKKSTPKERRTSKQSQSSKHSQSDATSDMQQHSSSSVRTKSPSVRTASASILTASDKSVRKPSTTRSTSDQTVSISESQTSSNDGRPLKQRSSFFKRVFGQSRSNGTSGAMHEPSLPELDEPPQLPPLNIKTQRPGKSRPRMNPNQYAGQLLYLPNPPTPSPPKDVGDPFQKLNKKPSFFRRKRRDAGDHDLAAPIDEGEDMSIFSGTSRTTSSTAEPSPSISSLRKVMNPYLLGTTSRTTSPQDLSPTAHFGKSSVDVITEEKVIDEVETVDPQRVSQDQVAASQNEMPRPSILTTALRDRPSAATMKRAHVGTEEDENDYVIDGTPQLRQDSFSEVSSTRNESPKRQRPNWTRLGDNTSHALDFSNVPNLHSTSIDVLNLRPTNLPEEVLQPVELPSSPSDDGWIMTTPVKEVESKVIVGKPHRIWLKASTSEELLGSDRWPLPPPPSPPKRSASISAQPIPTSVPPLPASTHFLGLEDSKITAGRLPISRPGSRAASRSVSRPGTSESAITARTPSSSTLVPVPTEQDYIRAKKIYDGGIAGFDQEQAAILLGETGPAADRLRKAYMNLYDFSKTNVLLGLRELCGRLVLKGETQQVDRILLAFSQRWTECNPDHGFKTLDVVHTLCYSLLLLNTDLHVAEVEQKMTRGQFVKNTLFAITQSVEDASTDGESTLRGLSKPGTPLHEEPPPLPKGPLLSLDSSNQRPSFETRPSDGRTSSLRSTMRPMSAVRSSNSPTPYDTRIPETGDALMSSSFQGSKKAWEPQLETLLKDFYTSVRLQRLPLFGAVKVPEQNSSIAAANAWLRRSGSTVSKAPADGNARGFAPDFRSVSSRWSMKTKSRPKLFSSSTMSSSRATSRTSLDDPSLWTPSPSSTWSKSNHGRLPATFSSDSLGTYAASGDYGIGFASTLGHAMNRGEFKGESESDGVLEPLLEEDELGLAGAPWAKEGIVQHKHHLEERDKKNKDRNWNECFAVVDKGWVRLFLFNSKASVRSQKNRSLRKGAVVGGGNWSENAEAIDSFMLRHTIANPLPSPGYSKTRPYVFALSLPTGAVHLFQVGTPEIALEFVATANYWSARLSKEPLMGGVSNVEYGWGSSIINTALLPSNTTDNDRLSTGATTNTTFPPSAHNFNPTSTTRNSMQGSIRNSLDGSRPKLPGDRMQLNDWTPQPQSMMASVLSEDEQLEALCRYVAGVEDELERHNELRPIMLLVFSNRHPNAVRAMNNWERKSSYLLREIVKFGTYIDSLNAARVEKARVKAEMIKATSAAGRMRGRTGGAGSAMTVGDSGTSTPTVREQEERLGGLSLVDEGRTM